MWSRDALASVGEMGKAAGPALLSTHGVRRLRFLRTGVLVAAFALCAACGQSSGGVVAAAPQAVAGGANLWVDANGGSCKRQAQAAPYADGQACATLQAAADAAASGDVVNIRQGTYGPQTLSGSKRLTFRGAGERPSLGLLAVSASNVTIAHVLLENRGTLPASGFCNTYAFGFVLTACGPNEVFDDVVVDAGRHPSGDPARRGGVAALDPATTFVFRNGEIRGVADQKGLEGGADGMRFESTLW